MENNDVLCLLLKEFKDNVSSSWRQLKDNKDFCDVTLACEKKQLPAHKFVLAASSPVFNEMLQNNSHPHPVIYLRGVQYKHLVNILEFVYRGQVNVQQEDLNGFLAVARDLCIKGLMEEDNEGNENFKELIGYEDLNKKRVKRENDETVLDNFMEEYRIMKKNLYLHDNVNEEVFKSKLLQNVMVEMEDDFDDDNFLIEESLKELSPSGLIGDQDISKQQIETFNENKFDEPSEKHDDTDGEVDGQKEIKNIKTEKKDTFSIKSDKDAVQHRKILHSCEQCEFTTPKKFLLKRHILSIHKHAKFSCEQCIYKASIKGNLKKHTQTVHEGIRYPCELCDFKATRKIYLTFHIKKIHNA